MVGSFSQTVMIWMGDNCPPISISAPLVPQPQIAIRLFLPPAEEIAKLPGVAAVDRLRAYEINFEGLPATLASADLNVLRSYHNSDFLSGRSKEQVLAELRDSNAVIFSEPFTYKQPFENRRFHNALAGGKRRRPPQSPTFITILQRARQYTDGPQDQLQYLPMQSRAHRISPFMFLRIAHRGCSN